MGLKRTPTKEKKPWLPEQVQTVADAIGAQADWMQASFILGYYQAARLRQCEVPLKDIDLQRRRITYWRTLKGRPLTKGNKPFSQPIAKAAIPLLRALIERRRKAGHADLCTIPVLPSVEWRRFLDSLGLKEISHHGLRVTWITQAALSRRKISREEAKAFVNHGSTAVHEIYQRLNADDVAHVADALGLRDLTPKVSRVSPPRRAARS
jgi:integrase